MQVSVESTENQGTCKGGCAIPIEICGNQKRNVIIFCLIYKLRRNNNSFANLSKIVFFVTPLKHNE